MLARVHTFCQVTCQLLPCRFIQNGTLQCHRKYTQIKNNNIFWKCVIIINISIICNNINVPFLNVIIYTAFQKFIHTQYFLRISALIILNKVLYYFFL